MMARPFGPYASVSEYIASHSPSTSVESCPANARRMTVSMTCMDARPPPHPVARQTIVRLDGHQDLAQRRSPIVGRRRRGGLDGSYALDLQGVSPASICVLIMPHDIVSAYMMARHAYRPSRTAAGGRHGPPQGRPQGGPYVCVSLVAWRVFQDPNVFRTSIPQ